MADCGDLFLQRKQADEDLRLLNEAADTMAVKGRYLARINNVPGMDRGDLADIYNRAAAEADTDEVRRAIEEGMAGLDPVAIGEGQPTNFRMLLAKHGKDFDTVRDYAELHRMIVSGHQQVDPGDYAALVQKWDADRLSDFLARSYRDMGVTKDMMQRLIGNTAPFARAVQRATEVRALAEGFQQGWHRLLLKAASEMEAGGLTPETSANLLNTYGLALTATRHWSLIRRRTGQTLRSMGIQLKTRALTEADVELGLKEATDFEPDEAGMPLVPRSRPRPGEEAVPEDRALVPNRDALGEGTIAGEMAKAITDGKSNPKKGAEALRNIAKLKRLEGLTLRDTFKTPRDYYNHMALYGIGLGKDFMLTNLRTQLGLNLPSNMLMAFYKPLHQMLENGLSFQAYGTGLSRKYLADSIQSATKGYADALHLTWARGRQLFLDSWGEGRNIYSSNKDLQSAVSTNIEPGFQGKSPNEIEMEYQRELDKLTWWPSAPSLSEVPGAENTALRVALTIGKLQAAVRIKAMEAGVPLPFTRIGHRGSAAVDNVAGFFLFNFKLRNDLHMEARMRAGELGLDTEKKIQDWVEQRASEEFTHYLPTRDEILQRRRNDPEIDSTMSDSDVGMLISNERARATEEGGEADTGLPGYWAPGGDSELSQDAWRFSEEGRFSQHRDDALSRGMQGLRGRWWGNALFPFWQVPLNGTLFDVGLMKNVVPPIYGMANKSLTPKQKAKMFADWTIAASLLASFVALDAMDGDKENLIVGNGPVSPRARAEWLVRIRAEGKQPNTVMGFPVAGWPVLNTLMMWRDIKENIPGGAYNKSEEANWVIGLTQVLTGLVARMPGVAQIQQIQGLLTADKSSWGDRAAGFVGYMAGSYTVPEIGAVRDVARYWPGGRLAPGDVLRTPDLTQAERDAAQADPAAAKDAGIDLGFIERIENALKGVAYGALPPTTALALRQERDHLGNRIRRPWGIGAIGDQVDPFAPQIWPEEDTRFYAELDRMGLLRTPEPLQKRVLAQVSMSPELQNEYLQTLISVRGDENVIGDMAIQSRMPRVNFKALLPIDLQRGLRIEKGISLGEYPLSMLVSDLVQGKTRVEALRAATKHPAYQYLANELPKSADIHLKRKSEATARQILNAVDGYYQMETVMRIRASSSPAAQEWKKRKALLDSANSIQEGVPRMLEVIEGLNKRPVVAEPAR